MIKIIIAIIISCSNLTGKKLVIGKKKSESDAKATKNCMPSRYLKSIDLISSYRETAPSKITPKTNTMGLGAI
jgi:hypothetical protein